MLFVLMSFSIDLNKNVSEVGYFRIAYCLPKYLIYGQGTMDLFNMPSQVTILSFNMVCVYNRGHEHAFPLGFIHFTAIQHL